jgi:hypothetical protein
MPGGDAWRSAGMEFDMRIFAVAACFMLLVGPAYAQMPNINLIPEIEHKSPEQKEQDQVRDKAYRESLKKIPDPKVSSDPWGNVRSNDAPKAVPAKSKSKAAATPN